MTRRIASISSAKNSRLDQRSRCQRAAHSRARPRARARPSRGRGRRRLDDVARKIQPIAAHSVAMAGAGAGRSDGVGAAVWGRPAWVENSTTVERRVEPCREISEPSPAFVARDCGRADCKRQARHRRGPTCAKHSKRPRPSGASVSGRSRRFTARRDQAGTLPALDEGPLTADAGLRAVARKA